MDSIESSVSASEPNDAGSSIPARRAAPWLLSEYDESNWKVSDTEDQEITEIIDFDYRLAKGVSLIEEPSLYNTVKQYAWFIRDSRLSKIDTAAAHYASVRKQLAIARYLYSVGKKSYRYLQKSDIETLIKRSVYGTDGVLQASTELESYFASLYDADLADLPLGIDLPVARNSQCIDATELMRRCGLPDGAKRLPRVAAVSAVMAERSGLRVSERTKRAIPAPKVATRQSIQRWLDAIDFTYIMGRFADCEVPLFRPFPNGVIATANSLGVRSKFTPVPPPRLVFRLVEQSARWISEHGPKVIDLLSRLQTLEDNPAARKRSSAAILVAWMSFPVSVRENMGMSKGVGSFPREAVKMVVAACWVVIATFSARRYEEVLDLRAGDLRGSDTEGWWLLCTITKPKRAREWIPVPIVVARAVELMRQLARVEEEPNEQNLFVWQMPAVLGTSSEMSFDLRKGLNIFAHIAGAKFSDPTQRVAWHWQPRQFRRFFAVLYFYRFEGADIAVLSYFLRHLDIETTRGYVTRDPEAAKIWREVEREYVGKLADSISSGDREVGGAMGDRLKKITRLIKDRLAKNLFVSGETVSASLMKVMERGLVITPKPWVTCTAPRTHNAARKANCRRGQEIAADVVGPSFADAGPTVCANCRWALMEPTKSLFSERKIDQLAAVEEAGSRSGTLFGDLERAHLVELRKVAEIRFDRGIDAPVN